MKDMIDPSNDRALIEAALAAGRVTKCPPHESSVVYRYDPKFGFPIAIRRRFDPETGQMIEVGPPGRSKCGEKALASAGQASVMRAQGRMERARAMFARGLTVEAVAEKIGVTAGTAQSYRSRLIDAGMLKPGMLQVTK